MTNTHNTALSEIITLRAELAAHAADDEAWIDLSMGELQRARELWELAIKNGEVRDEGR
jgi:hypothetical protein